MIARIPPALVWSLAAAVSISLGAAAGPLVWRLSGDEAPLQNAPGPVPAAQTTRADLQPILDFAPFGAVVGAAAETPAAVGETGLGLTLLGVTIATPATGSRAIIRGGDGPVRGYLIGEAVSAAATLSEIAADHVVLLVDGRRETLSFARPGTAPAATGGPDLRNLIPAAGVAAAPATASNAPDAVIARYRAAILQDAAGVMGRLGLEITDQGYRITEKASPGVRQAGFRAGDVVTTVNGQKVGDMIADQRYFDEVAASGRARVELLREGQTIVMSFPLR